MSNETQDTGMEFPNDEPTNGSTAETTLPITRRSALATIGGSVAALGIGGATFMASTAAASGVSISATNPGQISNDRGDLSKVTIDPSFRVEWENMDTAVAKVFYVIEGRTREDGSWGDWSPLFRSTPWLTPGSLQGVNASKPGTTGFIEFFDPLSAIMNRSSGARNSKGEDPRSLPRPIEVVNELGRPNYEGTSAFGSHPQSVDATTYLRGDSVGSADNAYSYLDDGRISTTADDPVETGSSSLTDSGGDLPLVNNFPGAESGYYGATTDTSQFDVEEDGDSDTDTVEIRYTFALQTLNSSEPLGDTDPNSQYNPLDSFTANPLGDYSTVEEAIRSDPWLENVRPADVVVGNSVLVMDGEDGYPSVTDHPDVNSPAANHYAGLQSIADAHPAVVSSTSSFTVTVENQPADSSVGGSSNAGAQGGGQ